MKNKITLTTIAATGILAVVALLFWQGGRLIKKSGEQVSKDEMTSATDYSVLEKDRLYTEEEGKYQNLNETGKKLLRDALMQSGCAPNTNETYCDNEQSVPNSTVVSINNGYALLKFPNFKGGYIYKAYSLKDKKFIASEVDSFSSVIRTEKILILIGVKKLWKYRVGDYSITPIENSDLQGGETFFKSKGLDYAESDSAISNSLLTLSVFSINKSSAEKIREMTFDLNNL